MYKPALNVLSGLHGARWTLAWAIRVWETLGIVWTRLPRGAGPRG